MYEVRRFLTSEGKDVFGMWLRQLKDTRGRTAVQTRLVRAAAGNLGDHKFCAEGVWEFRVTVGPGYRVYFGLEDRQVLLLLGGGDKGSLRSDIERAIASLKEWRSRYDARSQP